MKFLSQLFEARGTDWTSSAFARARTKLVLLYLFIIALVILLFGYLVILQVRDQISSSKLPPDSHIVLTAVDAQRKAEALKSGNQIQSTEYSLEDNTLLYNVVFDDGEDVEIDILTGRASLGEQNKTEPVTLFELLTDEIDEMIWWLGVLVFLLASVGSIAIAHMTLRPIAESVKRQKRFVSDAAHELRNPLASLHTTLESYLRSPDKSQEFNESVARDLLSEVKRLIATSESLLVLGKSETHPKNITMCNVGHSVHAVESRLASLLETRQVYLHKTISSTPLRIDPADFETILYNLVHNALKFSKEGSSIDITWDGKILTVSDKGCGIEAKHIPYIFERFYKVDSARTFATESSGLGLAIVYELVKSYKGTITLQSIVGEGTTVTLSL